MALFLHLVRSSPSLLKNKQVASKSRFSRGCYRFRFIPHSSALEKIADVVDLVELFAYRARVWDREELFEIELDREELFAIELDMD